jgi:uncharacterized protein (DUF1330 family)
MPVYVIAQGRIEDAEKLGAYAAKALPTIAAAGGRVLGYDESPDVVEGEIHHPRTVLLEFESKEQFRRWYDSAEYQEILPMRLEAQPGTLIVIEGVPKR